MHVNFDLQSHGLAGYIGAKHGVVGLMRYYACALAEKNIRVNTVHPTGLASPMLVNEPVGQFFAENPDGIASMKNLLDVDLIEDGGHHRGDGLPVRRSGRYVTGTTLTVDAGYTVK